MPAVSKPECSATPTPRSATSTVPSGTKLVKLVTRLLTIMRSPSPVIRLTARIMPSSARPPEPTGRGSSTARSSHPAMPLMSTTAKANSAKSVTGWGSRLPSHSTVLRKRLNHPRSASPSGVCSPGAWSGTGAGACGNSSGALAASGAGSGTRPAAPPGSRSSGEGGRSDIRAWGTSGKIFGAASGARGRVRIPPRHAPMRKRPGLSRGAGPHSGSPEAGVLERLAARGRRQRLKRASGASARVRCVSSPAGRRSSGARCTCRSAGRSR